MRWTTVARAALAVIGLGCAAAILIYTQNRQQPPLPATSLPPVDPSAASVGGTGQEKHLRTGRSPIKVSYAAFRTSDDGRVRFDKARIEGLEDTRFTITCDTLETRGKSGKGDRPGQYDCSGHVELISDDGLRLESETANYDDGTNLLTIPGPVKFAKGRLSGGGMGATYDRATDAFRILDQATAHVDPDAQGKGAADATSTRMSLVRGQHMLLLDGQARIVGESQTLTGNEATLAFKEDDSAIKYLELRGAGRVTPKAGASGDRPGMSADNITMAFLEDGLTLQHATLTGRGVLTLGGKAASQSIRASWIDLYVAPDGSTVTRLAARDRVVVELPATTSAAGRTITSTTLSTTGDDKRGLTSAQFEGNPKFEELPVLGPRRGGAAPARTPVRTGTAITLVLTLGGRLDAIERADFRQKAEFHDGTMTGVADNAAYNEGKGTLKLTPNEREPRRVSRVTTPDLTVEASAIDVELGTQNLDARGSVRTTATPSAKDSAPGSLFQGSEKILGAAETFQYKKETGVGTYDGTAAAPARLWQDETSVAATRLVFTDASRDLDAIGGVDSRWELAEGSSAALKRYSVRADILKYGEARGTAVYTGTLVTLTTAEGDIESRRLTLRLASASRTLESLHAERMDGEYVFARLGGGYEGRGDDLVYRAVDETYVLKGKPAFAKAPKEQTGVPAAGARDCTVQQSLVFEFYRRTNEWGIPGRGEAPRTGTEESCSVDLRKIKK